MKAYKKQMLYGAIGNQKLTFLFFNHFLIKFEFLQVILGMQ